MSEFNTCPYCGSHDIAVDADIRVNFHIDPDTGDLDYKGSAADLAQDVLEGLGEIVPQEDMQGFCHDCDCYSDVKCIEEGKGIMFEKIDSDYGETKMNLKYVLLGQEMKRHAKRA